MPLCCCLLGAVLGVWVRARRCARREHTYVSDMSSSVCVRVFVFWAVCCMISRWQRKVTNNTVPQSVERTCVRRAFTERRF